MKSFFALALAGAASAELFLAEDLQFINYAAKYNKHYGSMVDFNHRREQFLKTHAFIQENNNSGNSTHIAAHNKFSDYTEDEFKAMMNGRKAQTLPSHIEQKIPVGDAPASVDWRTTGNVTPVQDQGSCGSCWTFSTTGVLESAYSIDSGNLVKLSE